MAGTTPKARALGVELKAAREAAGLGVRKLADMLETSHPTVSRWENGHRAPRPEDVAAYLAKVGATAEQRGRLVELSRDADGSHWLSIGMPEQHRQLAALLDIERTATDVVTVSPLLIPGLLQTGDYARAIMMTGGVPASEVDTRVAVRIGRREAITRKRPARLTAFIWEPALRQEIGGPDVMCEQLQALVDYGARPNVDLRVIPTRCPWHPGLAGPFALARFDDRDTVVHLENQISGLFLHEPDEVKVYEDALDRVNEVSMSSGASIELIADVINTEETAQ